MTSINNRNESYKGVVDRLPQKRKEVYELIKSNPNITIQEAAEKLGKPINEVSGRFTELKEVFLIIELDNKTNGRSGFKNTSYCAVDKDFSLRMAELELDLLDNLIDSLASDWCRVHYGESKIVIKNEMERLLKRKSRIKKAWNI